MDPCAHIIVYDVIINRLTAVLVASICMYYIVQQYSVASVFRHVVIYIKY